jgi:hypothetical protein
MSDDRLVPFDDLTASFSPARRARIQQRAQRELQRIGRRDLRRTSAVTQAEVAATLGLDQSVVSRLERRRNPTVASLAEYVRALGGTLELHVRYADGRCFALDPEDFSRPRALRERRPSPAPTPDPAP